jgi:hypothetical protein
MQEWIDAVHDLIRAEIEAGMRRYAEIAEGLVTPDVMDVE